jgi:hypothetical protein
MKTAVKKKSPRKKKKWSAHVNQTSDALDLEKNVFTSGSAQHIAESLKLSSDHSKRRKGSSFQSAMSMLSFYINRAGKNLPGSKKRTLETARDKLRKLYHLENRNPD